MSYPDKLKVSGTLSVGPGGDRQLVPIVPAVIVQDGEENGRPTWGVAASGWAIKIRWIDGGLSSYWRMEITRPDAVIGIWSSEGSGGAEELIGLYVQVSRATGTATVVANMEGIEAPVITGVVADTNSLTVSLTGVDAATHTLLYRLSTATEWTTGGTRTGNGNVTISGLSAGTYYVMAYSTLAGVNSTPGNLVTSTILDNPTQGDDYVSDTGITVTVDNDNLVVNITGKPGASHRVLYKTSTENVWKEGGVRSGDGQVTITSLPAATYHVQVKSV